MLRHPSNVQIIQYGVPGLLQVERNGEGDIETAVLQDKLSAKYLQIMLEKAVQAAHNEDVLRAKMNAAAWEASYRAIKDE